MSNRHRDRVKRAAILLAAVPPATLVCGAMAVAWAGYNRVAHGLVTVAGKAHQEAAFKATYFTPTTFTALIALIVILATAAGCLAYLLSVHFDRVATSAAGAVRAAVGLLADAMSRLRGLRSGTKASLALLVGLQLMIVGVRATRFPVSYDEAWTFQNFTSRSVLASMAYYPAPNNHILFSILTNITSVLPFPAILDMRLISIVCALLTTLVLLAVGLQYFDEAAVTVALALLVFSYPVSLYSMQARGYALLLLFTAVCFGSALELLTNRAPTRAAWAAYVASSVLGFYTIPSFLYAFASVNLAACVVGGRKKDFAFARSWVLADGAVAAGTLILYTPVFLVSGVRAVTADRVPLAQVLVRMPAHLSATANWLWDGETGGLAIVLGLAAVTALLFLRATDERRSLVRGSMLLVLLLPPAIMIVHRAIPFERTWIYLLVPLFVLIADLIDSALTLTAPRRMLVHWALPVAIVLIAWPSAARFGQRYQREFSRDFDADRLFAGIPAASLRSVAYDDVYFADLLTYRLQIARRDWVVSRRVSPGRPVDADVLLVTEGAPAVPNLGDYTLWRRNDRIMVYLLKAPDRSR